MNDIGVIMLGKNGTRGFTIVDADMFQDLNKTLWRSKHNGYIHRMIGSTSHGDRSGYMVYLHHQVLGGRKPGLDTDHINRCRFDNRRSNLRWVTRSQNLFNMTKRSRTSRFKGVTWKSDGRRLCWVAQVVYQGRSVYSRGFITEEQAADARDRVAAVYHGEYVNLNFQRIRI